MQDKSKRAKQVFIGTGVLIVLFMLIFPGAIRYWHKKDQEGVPVRNGTATVVFLVPPGDEAMGNSAKPYVRVRFHNGLYPAKEVVNYAALHEGQPARIAYRVGKSGAIYVLRVEPQ